MINLILIVFCVVAGMVLQRTGLIARDAYKGINTWILYFALPAVSFKYIPKIQWTVEMLVPVVSVQIVWFGAWLLMACYSKSRGYRQRTQSTLELSAGYSNTSFVGFPLIAAYFGEEHLGIAIISDQATFALLSIAGVIAALKATRTEGQGSNTGMIFKRLITFPPLVGCTLAIVLSQFVDLSYTEAFFDKLAVTVAPLALFSIGLQLQFDGWRQQLSVLSVALLYKLLIAPLLVLGFVLLIGIRGDVARISVFEAAMPTLLSTSIVAEQFRLNTRLINLIIGFSIILGLLTTAMWDLVIKYLL